MPDCFIVAGPPRSGTSLIAGFMHRLGVRMGSSSNFLPANKDNPTGYYEDVNFVFLNDSILERAGGSVWSPPSRSQILNAGKIQNLQDQIDYQISKKTGDGPWGWKDPRNCITLPIYLNHCKPSVVVCHRDSRLIAESITEMNPGLSHQQAFDIASEYYERLIGVIRTEGIPHTIMYHELTLMDPDEAISQLLNFTGVERNDDRVENCLEFVVPPCR